MVSNCELGVGNDQDYLRKNFNYVDGQLLKKRNGKSGLQIGCLHPTGYCRTAIKGVGYSIHRMIWAWHYGSTEGKCIDHINGVKDDNRIENLRLATVTENQHNRKVNKNSTTGVKGVSLRGDKYLAYIKVNKRQCHLGSYETLAEAAAAYHGAAILAQGEFRYR